MRYRRTVVLFIATVTFATTVQSEAQVSLYPFVSAETNAMGGAGVSFVSDNALATIANPAELGLFSLHGVLSASYLGKIPGQLSAFAVNAGLGLSPLRLSVPFKLGLGIGYSNPRYSYPYRFGFVPRTQTDAVNALTLGLGLQYVVRLALGYTLKWVTTEGTPGYYRSTYAPDLGAMLQIPVMNVLSKLSGFRVSPAKSTVPFFDITLGYSKRNLANYDPYSSAEVPREADLGWNFELGLRARIRHVAWRLLSFTWVRQAEASLVSNQDTTVSYMNGLGGFQVYDNLLAGKLASSAVLLKGWQLGLASLVYLRGGSVSQAQSRFNILGTHISTFGWGVRLDGLIKTLLFLHFLHARSYIVDVLLNDIDLRLDYSRTNGPLPYSYAQTVFLGRPMATLSLVIR